MGRAGGASRIPDQSWALSTTDDTWRAWGLNQVLGWRRCQGFSGVARFLSFGGGETAKCRGPGDGCGEAGVGKGMEAFGRARHRLPAPRRRRADPPFQRGRGVLSRRPRGGCPTGFGLTIKLIIVSLNRSFHPLKTPVGQRYKHLA